MLNKQYTIEHNKLEEVKLLPYLSTLPKVFNNSNEGIFSFGMRLAFSEVLHESCKVLS